ncbi:dipeptidase PepV [Paenibacillus sp. 102]|uniref:dipeptidase PepV n=1 Tax=Paenibacillus sp. 102 TaxID=3120823 RepID=UPI0031BA517A
MNAVSWKDEVEKRQHCLIEDTCRFLKIKSVLDETSISENAPFGEGIRQALEFLLDKGHVDGFITKNVDGYAGHIEIGEGKELVGILCHIDVVPEGEGWTTPPYSADIRDNKIYARGALDNKGPAMAIYYALKIIKELQLPLRKRIRMIIGTDEESSWKCVKHYFNQEEVPSMGFAPDAAFPIVHSEKGICNFYFCQVHQYKGAENSLLQLIHFRAGARLNMVPDYAEALIQNGLYGDIGEIYREYISSHNLEGSLDVKDGHVLLKLRGVSAHGMEPETGKNAGLFLLKFLNTLPLDEKAMEFTEFTTKYLLRDSRGKALGISHQNEEAGDLTINIGQMYYSQEKGGTIGANLRYPITCDIDKTIANIKNFAHAMHFSVENIENSFPHYVKKDANIIQVLQRVYEEWTKQPAKLLSLGGATYARSIPNGVAFGPSFPGDQEVAHQKDEYIEISHLLKLTSIYVHAIYELAK